MARPVAVATCAEFPALPDAERPLLGALRALGVGAEPAVWDEPGVDWTRFSAVVLRSTWDYHRKALAFRAWIDGLEAAGIALWNPAKVVRANLDKRYLRGLEASGTAVVPTAWVERASPRPLDEVLAERGWSEAVIKPAVSASAFLTRRVARGAPGAQAALDAALAQSDAMVQPYLPEIAEEGEWSFVFLDGAFSHAALKVPARGDFRVQAEHGGRAERREPPPELLAQAARAAALIEGRPLYARVDGVRRGRALLLIELELIEPTLFLDLAPGAAEALARGVAARLSNSGAK
jgi:glutathione synthase/RimK-type ligase-like ATP-grasp enzyme